MDGAEWAGVDAPVRRTTSLAMFTDGLVEGFDAPGSGRRLGDARLYELISDEIRRGAAGSDLLDRVLTEVRDRNGGDLSDDVAVLVLSWADWG
jgi:serine phosphatase RsbU (regulator of sigma subunit)